MGELYQIARLDLYKTRLPYDYFRCVGTNCDRKQDCLRNKALDDTKPYTPMTDMACDHGDEFWPVEVEA